MAKSSKSASGDGFVIKAGQSFEREHEQAHRKIYLLTDAEVATRNYSNRFAAHILRQHQFKALCDQRGWRYEFLGSWDQPNMVATRDLAGWDLRAEFWIEHADAEYAPSGVALHVATDQVQFVHPDPTVCDLADVPALVLSEVMRDVDLFVAVCSVGNDPTWADGGENRSRNTGGNGPSANSTPRQPRGTTSSSA